jgi:hypothetical protein
MLDTLSFNPGLPPLMTGAELAEAMRYSGVTSAFRQSLRMLGITPVPGRHDIYDPLLVRHRLNVAQGMLPPASGASGVATVDKPLSKTQQRRNRNGKK